MTYDPIAQSEALIGELRELREERNSFEMGEKESKEFEESFDFCLRQVVTGKVIGEHPEIHLTEQEQENLRESGYGLAQAIRELRESMEFLRRVKPDDFQARS